MYNSLKTSIFRWAFVFDSDDREDLLGIPAKQKEFHLLNIISVTEPNLGLLASEQQSQSTDRLVAVIKSAMFIVNALVQGGQWLVL